MTDQQNQTTENIHLQSEVWDFQLSWRMAPFCKNQIKFMPKEHMVSPVQTIVQTYLAWNHSVDKFPCIENMYQLVIHTFILPQTHDQYEILLGQQENSCKCDLMSIHRHIKIEQAYLQYGLLVFPGKRCFKHFHICVLIYTVQFHNPNLHISLLCDKHQDTGVIVLFNLCRLIQMLNCIHFLSEYCFIRAQDLMYTYKGYIQFMNSIMTLKLFYGQFSQSAGHLNSNTQWRTVQDFGPSALGESMYHS